MKTKAKIFSVFLLVVCLILIFGGWYLEILRVPRLSEPLSWYGITPGRTTLSESLDLLGEPSKIEIRDKYLVHYYNDKTLWGWEVVELWSLVEDKKFIIESIYLFFPNYSTSLGESTHFSHLIDLVLVFGRPEKVTWSSGCRTRTLTWPMKGVMVVADANVKLKDWSEIGVGEMVISYPMGVREFLKTARQWPWPMGAGIVDENMCASTEDNTRFPDRYPEDPYDWEHMPTPTKH